MPEQVQAWKAGNGQLYHTFTDALTADARHSLMQLPGIDTLNVSTFELLFTNRVLRLRMLDLLEKYQTKLDDYDETNDDDPLGRPSVDRDCRASAVRSLRPLPLW